MCLGLTCVSSGRVAFSRTCSSSLDMAPLNSLTYLVDMVCAVVTALVVADFIVEYSGREFFKLVNPDRRLVEAEAAARPAPATYGASWELLDGGGARDRALFGRRFDREEDEDEDEDGGGKSSSE